MYGIRYTCKILSPLFWADLILIKKMAESRILATAREAAANEIDWVSSVSCVPEPELSARSRIF